MAKKVFLYSFYLACLSIFFATVRLQNYNFKLCDFFFVICFFFTPGLKQENSIDRRLKEQLVPLVSIFVIGLFVSSLLNGNVEDALITISQYLFVFLLLPFLFTFLSEKELIIAVKLVIVSFILVALFGIYVYYIKGSLQYTYIYSQTRGDRVSSFLGNANTFGRTAVACLILGVYLYNKKYISWLWFLLISFICCWGLFLSSSFGGFIALFIAGSLYFFNKLRKLIIYLTIGFGIVLLLPKESFFKFLPDIFQKRMVEKVQEDGTSGAGSLEERTVLFKKAFNLAASNPVLGVGPGKFNEENSVSAHNAFLIIWLEGGIVTLLSLLFLMAVVFFYCLNSKIIGVTKEKYLILSMLGSLFIALNTSNHFYGRNVLFPLFFSIFLYLINKKSNASFNSNSNL